ncbi:MULTISPECIES: glycosyltransferase family 1 protein [unclassified Streptomyces]|uniref:glycosyltransferase family 1 protein n=1 Tax=unclassified Streptomyces TaxID=2593676 RepID=UPI001F084540|nr:glycosyltransferase family 1 protein [Streptomyces sp. CB09001]
MDVLVVVGRTPSTETLSAFVAELKQGDARVHLVGTFSERAIDADWGLDTVRRVATDGANLDWRARAHALEVHPHERFWAYVGADQDVLRLAKAADVIVAVDGKAYYSAWELARLNPAAHACVGFAAAQRTARALRDGTARPPVAEQQRSEPDGRQDEERSSDLALLLGNEKLLGSRVGSALARRVPLLPLSEKTRVDMTRNLVLGLFGAKRNQAALATASATASRLRDTRARAEVLRVATRRALANGSTPATLLASAEADLAHADHLYEAQDPEGAAEFVNHALATAFHRVAHIDQRKSPLTTRAAEFARLTAASTAASAVAGDRGRARPVAEPEPGRPRRLLVVTDGNDNFLGLIRDHYASNPDVELRFLDITDHPGIKRLAGDRRRLMAYRLGGDAMYGFTTEQHLRPHLDWADTVFIDWCAAAAALFTSVDPGTARIVVRLHSYEAFSHWPRLTDFSRVDDLIFVADHVRDLALDSVPALTGPHAPRTHIVDNGMDLAGFALPKSADARFTVGMVGIGQVAKDPLWALRVIRELRRRDERYRLVLIGGDMNGKASKAAGTYERNFRSKVIPLEAQGAVERRGATSDVPGNLRDVGVILSSSVREGCHVGVMEGAASGAVPVVRDWPFFAGKKHGASTLYPADWVVSTPEAAADRILAVTADEETWSQHCRASEKHALATWDWPVVRGEFDRVFGIG